MKHRAPQFDLPGQESAFNLSGELLKQAPPVKQPDTKPDLTPSLFPCGRKAWGIMPACVLEAGHLGDCTDGFGGWYSHKPEMPKELRRDTLASLKINPEPRKDKTE